jgi:hypothetical protein
MDSAPPMRELFDRVERSLEKTENDRRQACVVPATVTTTQLAPLEISSACP